jgi:hypothetical protein
LACAALDPGAHGLTYSGGSQPLRCSLPLSLSRIYLAFTVDSRLPLQGRASRHAGLVAI